MITTVYTGPIKLAGNGSTLAFNFSFKILNASDLQVWKIDANGVKSSLLVLGTDYTVTFDSIAEDGTVTYTVAPVSGGYAVIGRATDDTQQSSLPVEGPLPAKTIETMCDKLQAEIQDSNANYGALVATGAAAASAASGVIVLNGTFANRPSAPTVPTIYESTDLNQIDYYSVKLAKWVTLG